MDDLIRRGYAGLYAEVDLAEGTARVLPTPAEAAERVLGGNGLAAWYLWRNLPAGVEPLAPENILVLFTGPLTGTLAPACGRWGMAAQGPRRRGYTDAYAGGGFGTALKAAGLDFVALRGRAPRPVVLVLDGDASPVAMRLEEAGDLWGQDVASSSRALAGRYPHFAAITIGPAGERRSPLAGVVCAGGLAAGRGGLGAVLGSKNLKAVLVRGHRPVRVWDSAAFLQACRLANRALRAGLERRGVFPGADGQATGGPSRQRQRLGGRRQGRVDPACLGCPGLCREGGRIPEDTAPQRNPYAGTGLSEPSSTVFTALGASLGRVDRADLLRMAFLCDLYGADALGVARAAAAVLAGREGARAADPAGLLSLVEGLCGGTIPVEPWLSPPEAPASQPGEAGSPGGTAGRGAQGRCGQPGKAPPALANLLVQCRRVSAALPPEALHALVVAATGWSYPSPAALQEVAQRVQRLMVCLDQGKQA